MLFTTKSVKDGILSAGIFPQVDSESNSELSQTSKMEFLAKVVNGRKTLTIFAKSSILHV